MHEFSCCFLFFFFKQKTAYEMRISDWSSDVCSSDLNWDMMLDLMLAREQDRQLSASDLATGAGVPLSSGLRMIAALEQEGLVHRAIDEKDRRRSLIRLRDAGADRLQPDFETIRRAWNERPRRSEEGRVGKGGVR